MRTNYLFHWFVNNNEDVFSRHLPPRLYAYLIERNLLDGKTKTFNSIQHHNATMEISVTAIPANQHYASHVAIKLTVNKEPNGYFHRYTFRDKKFYYENFIGAHGMMHSTGLKSICSEDALTQRECKEITPRKVNALMFTLSFAIKEIRNELENHYGV